MKLLCDLAHSSHVCLSIGKRSVDIKGIWGRVVDQVGIESLAVLVPLLNHGLLGSPGSGNLGRARRLAAAVGYDLGKILALPLAALRVLVRLRDNLRRDRRCGGYANGAAVVVVYTPHVVLEVPVPGEAIAWEGTITTLISAEVWLVTVAVHGVSLALMAEETSSGGETSVLTRGDLTAVGLQVRVDEFAVKSTCQYGWTCIKSRQATYS